MFSNLLFLLTSVSALKPGHVFGIRTRTPHNPSVDGRSLYVYADHTIGLYDPYNDVPEFNGVLMPDYGVIFQPEPLMALKTSDRNILTMSSSLYDPLVGMYEENGRLKSTAPDTRFVICPSWNDVLLFDDGEHEVCPDAVEVLLEIKTY